MVWYGAMGCFWLLLVLLIIVVIVALPLTMVVVMVPLSVRLILVMVDGNLICSDNLISAVAPPTMSSRPRVSKVGITNADSIGHT